MRLLIVNPGSTSTKVAIYEDGKPAVAETLRHSNEDLAKFPLVSDQLEFRSSAVREFMASYGDPKLDAVVGRGGLLPPRPSGVYEVDDEIYDLLLHPKGQHASNLGGLIARDIASARGVKAYIADGVTTDELCDLARYTGHPMMQRVSIFHALNQKSVARRVSSDLGRRYEDTNLIVCHLGGGVSVGAHLNGKVVDVANALDGEGPFAPERAGTLPLTGLIDLCFSGEYTHSQARKLLSGGGGFVAHIGTNSGTKLEEMVASGDAHAALIEKAFVYCIVKEIGRMAAVLEGKVDAIVVTGGLAHSNSICSMIEDKVSAIARVMRYPGEDEMLALAEAGARALRSKAN